MKVRAVNAARVVAWAVVVGAVCAVAIGYDSLPAELPLTRWTTAPKSVFLALRVPLINLMTLGLIEVLSPGLRRVTDFERAGAILAILLLTVAAKAGIEAAGILMLPTPFTWTLIPLVAVLSVGLGLAVFFGRDLLRLERWKQMHMTRPETAGAVALVTGIVVLNLPLITR
jgi:hypothetical protein